MGQVLLHHWRVSPWTPSADAYVWRYSMKQTTWMSWAQIQSHLICGAQSTKSPCCSWIHSWLSRPIESQKSRKNLMGKKNIIFNWAIFCNYCFLRWHGWCNRKIKLMATAWVRKQGTLETVFLRRYIDRLWTISVHYWHTSAQAGLTEGLL